MGNYEGLSVGTLVVSIEGAAFSHELRVPARSSSLDNLLGLPSPYLLAGEAQGREWLVGGQRLFLFLFLFLLRMLSPSKGCTP